MWSGEADELLRRLWPLASMEELLAAFPSSSFCALTHRASRLGVRRETPRPPASRLALAWSSSGNARRGRGLAAPIEVRDGVEGKICVRCEQWKPILKFGRHKTCHGGRRNLCTTCEGRIARTRNPDAGRLMSAKRHALKMGSESGVTIAEIRAIKKAYGNMCAYCGRPAATVDHVIPLARGGPHIASNLVPACGSCNSQKGNRTPEEWRAGTKAPQYENRKKGV